jgi:hypothetical protein
MRLDMHQGGPIVYEVLTHDGGGKVESHWKELSKFRIIDNTIDCREFGVVQASWDRAPKAVEPSIQCQCDTLAIA